MAFFLEARVKMNAFLKIAAYACCATTLIHNNAAANSIPTVSFQSLVEKAENVVIGKVIAAELIYSGRYECGVIYSVRLERILKGGGESKKIITYGSFIGDVVGSRYLFMMERFSLGSLLGSRAKSLNEADRNCKKKYNPEFSIAHYGMARFELSVGALDGVVQTMVVFPEKWISPPAEVRFDVDSDSTVWGRKKSVGLIDLIKCCFE